MEQNVIQKDMWNLAAKAGLVLGIVSAAYVFIVRLTGMAGLPSVASMAVNFLLWGLKFGGCIWLMMFFMKKFAAEHPKAINADTRRFGIITALLSALVYSTFCLADISFISPEYYTQPIEQMLQESAPMLDSNSLSKVDSIMGMLPQLTFFSNLIYCFIYGTIVSAFLSINIPSRNPFENNKSDE